LHRDWKVDTACFQESKLDFMSPSVVHSLWGCHHVDWCCLDSSGASGGILIMWDKRVVEKIDEFVGDFTLVVTFRNVVDHSIWAFLRVSMALILIGIEGFFRMSWLVWSIGGNALLYWG
jgi:hypothetical protein